MAGILASLITGAEVALAANTPKTVLQITAPTNQRLLLKKIGFFFDGVSSTGEPSVVKLIKQSTAGSGGTSASPAMIGAGSETLQATGLYGITTEPTATATLDIWEIHPQQGWQEMISLDLPYPVLGGTRMGIQVTLPVGATAINCHAKFVYEE